MKAMLLRIGIDKGTDGTLAPIFEDGTFEYIPISEGDPNSNEDRTYNNTLGRKGLYLSTYLPKKIANRTMHYDPEFLTYTYGDPTSKRKYLVKLQQNDLLIFYAGLIPYKNNAYSNGLYIIGFFTIDDVIDFNTISSDKIDYYRKKFFNNAHIKRNMSTQDLVIVSGNLKKSKLLDKAILISEPKLNKINRPYFAVSKKIEEKLGISGSIQRSIPPRFMTDDVYIKNLKNILDLNI